MKRIAAGLFAGILVIFGGCRPISPPAVRATDFSCDFNATLGDMALSGTLKRYTAGTLELAFEQPDTLKGLTARWDGEKVQLQLYGLSFDVPADSLPEQALGEALIGALDEALRGETTGTLQDGVLTVEGDLDGVTYTLVCDGTSGLPRRLTVPAYEVNVTFIEK